MASPDAIFTWAMRGDVEDVVAKLRVLEAQARSTFATTMGSLHELQNSHAQALQGMQQQQRAYTQQLQENSRQIADARKAETESLKRLKEVQDTYVAALDNLRSNEERLQQQFTRTNTQLDAKTQALTKTAASLAAARNQVTAFVNEEDKLKLALEANEKTLEALTSRLDRARDAYRGLETAASTASTRATGIRSGVAAGTATAEDANRADEAALAAENRRKRALEDIQLLEARIANETKSEIKNTDDLALATSKRVVLEERVSNILRSQGALQTQRITLANQLHEINARINLLKEAEAAAEKKYNADLGVENSLYNSINTSLGRLRADRVAIQQAQTLNRTAIEEENRLFLEQRRLIQGEADDFKRVGAEAARARNQTLFDQEHLNKEGHRAGVTAGTALLAGMVGFLAGGPVGAAIGAALTAAAGIGISMLKDSANAGARAIGALLSGFASGIASVFSGVFNIVSSVVSTITSAVSSLIGIVGRGVAAIGTMVGTVQQMASAFGEAATQIRNISIASGLTERQVSGLTPVFQAVGGQAFILEAAMGAVVEKAGANEEAFVRLGVATRNNTTGALLPTIQILGNLADALQNSTDKQGALANMQKIFGSWLSGTMLPLLAGGRQGLTDWIETANRLGLVMDTEMVQKGLRVQMSLSLINQGIAQIRNTFIAGLEPVIVRIAELFVTNLNKILVKVAEFSVTVAAVINSFIQGLFGVNLKIDEGAIKLINALSRSTAEQQANTAAVGQAQATEGDRKAGLDAITRQQHANTDAIHDATAAQHANTAETHDAIAGLQAYQNQLQATIRAEQERYANARQPLEDHIVDTRATIASRERDLVPYQNRVDNLTRSLQHTALAEHLLQIEADKVKSALDQSLQPYQHSLEDVNRRLNQLRQDEAALVQPLERQKAGWSEFTRLLGLFRTQGTDNATNSVANLLQVLDAAGVAVDHDSVQWTNLIHTLGNLNEVAKRYGVEGVDGLKEKMGELDDAIARERAQQEAANRTNQEAVDAITEQIEALNEQLDALQQLDEQNQEAEQSSQDLFSAYRQGAHQLGELQIPNRIAALYGQASGSRPELPVDDQAITRAQRLQEIERQLATAQEHLDSATQALNRNYQAEIDTLNTLINQDQTRLNLMEETTRAEQQARSTAEIQLRLADARGETELGRLLKERDALQQNDTIRRQQGESLADFQRRQQQAAIAHRIDEIQQERQMADLEQAARDDEQSRALEAERAQLAARIALNQDAVKAVQDAWDTATKARDDAQQQVDQLLQQQTALNNEVADFNKKLQEAIAAQQAWLDQMVTVNLAAAADAGKQSDQMKKIASETEKAIKERIKQLRAQAKSLQLSMNAAKRASDAKISALEAEKNTIQSAIELVDKGLRPVLALADKESSNLDTRMNGIKTFFENQIRPLAAEALELQGRIEQLQRDAEPILNDLNNRINQLKDSETARRLAIEQLQLQIDDKKAQLKPLQQEIDDTQRTIDQMRTDEERNLRDMRTALANVSDEIGNMRTAAQNYNDDMTALRDNAQGLNDDLIADKDTFKLLPLTQAITDANTGLGNMPKQIDAIRDAFLGLNVGSHGPSLDQNEITGDPAFAQQESQWQTVGRRVGQWIHDAILGDDKAQAWIDLGKKIGEKVVEGLKLAVKEGGQHLWDDFLSELDADTLRDLHLPAPVAAVDAARNRHIVDVSRQIGNTLGQEVQNGLIEFLKQNKNVDPEKLQEAWNAWAWKHKDFSKEAFLNQFLPEYKASLSKTIGDGAADGVKQASLPKEEIGGSGGYIEKLGVTFRDSSDDLKSSVADTTSGTMSDGTASGIDDAQRGLSRFSDVTRAIGDLSTSLGKAVTNVFHKEYRDSDDNAVSNSLRDALLAAMAKGLQASADKLESNEEFTAATSALNTSIFNALHAALSPAFNDTTSEIETNFRTWWQHLSDFLIKEVKPWDSKAIQQNWTDWADGITEKIHTTFDPDAKPGTGGDALHTWWAGIDAFLRDVVKPWDSVKDNFYSLEEHLAGSFTGAPGQNRDALAAWADQTSQQRRQNQEKITGIFPELTAYFDSWWTDLTTNHMMKWDPWEATHTLWETYRDNIIKIFKDLKEGENSIPVVMTAILNAMGERSSHLWETFQPGVALLIEKFYQSMQLIIDVVNALASKLLAQDQILPNLTAPTVPGAAASSVPQFAAGGIYSAQPGGLYRLAEGGQDEGVISFDPSYRQHSRNLLRQFSRRLGTGGPEDDPEPHPDLEDTNAGADQGGDTGTITRGFNGRGQWRDPAGLLPDPSDLNEYVRQYFGAVASVADAVRPLLEGNLLNNARQATVEAATPFYANMPTGMSDTFTQMRDQRVQVGTDQVAAQVSNWLRALNTVLGGFTLPAEGTLTQRFGPASGENGYSFHTGVDIANAIGTAILAAMYGEVSAIGDTGVDGAGNGGGYGQWMSIQHDNRVSTLYGHLLRGSALKSAGERVEAGEQIAQMGNTGNSTGPHLHFESRFSDSPYNPIDGTTQSGVPLEQTVPLFSRMALQALGLADVSTFVDPQLRALVIREVQHLYPQWMDQIDDLMNIIMYESSGVTGIPNRQGSGATGLFQLMPFNVPTYMTRYGDRLGDTIGEIRGGLRYIADVYHSPHAAWLQELRGGTYDLGGLTGFQGPHLGPAGMETVIDPATTRGLINKGLIRMRAGGFPTIAPEIASMAQDGGSNLISYSTKSTAGNTYNTHATINLAPAQRTRQQEAAWIRQTIQEALV